MFPQTDDDGSSHLKRCFQTFLLRYCGLRHFYLAFCHVRTLLAVDSTDDGTDRHDYPVSRAALVPVLQGLEQWVK